MPRPIPMFNKLPDHRKEKLANYKPAPGLRKDDKRSLSPRRTGATGGPGSQDSAMSGETPAGEAAELLPDFGIVGRLMIQGLALYFIIVFRDLLPLSRDGVDGRTVLDSIR